MSTDSATVEQRLAVLEAAVAEIQRRLALETTSPNWLEQITGIVKDQEVFEEMMKYAREYRHADDLPEAAEEPAA